MKWTVSWCGTSLCFFVFAFIWAQNGENPGVGLLVWAFFLGLLFAFVSGKDWEKKLAKDKFPILTFLIGTCLVNGLLLLPGWPMLIILTVAYAGALVLALITWITKTTKTA